MLPETTRVSFAMFAALALALLATLAIERCHRNRIAAECVVACSPLSVEECRRNEKLYAICTEVDGGASLRVQP